ncbi:glycosyltransferase family 4 protein [Algibacter lectus]|uniref:glycosyltransferase family 4 protein n=1 Tax=Algibacter lectus TaxID=221126 RepID=UPI002495083A|nr:glycosyltransferase [Algibacter lectus]
MDNKPLNILVSAYACGPKWGSEIGMGWNWITNLANYCQLHVITESGFKNDIDEILSSLNLKYKPKFYFVDIGNKGRELFWKQGSFLFYKHYKLWQQSALTVAKDIIKNNKDIDIIHQLNMIGFREPGFLYKIENIPYVLGPLGGFGMFPMKYFSLLNIKDKAFYVAKNTINMLQKTLLSRPKKAIKRADLIYLATDSGSEYIKNLSQSFKLLSETGAYNLESDTSNNKTFNGKLKLSWVGLLHGRKGLPLALQAISQSKHKKHITIDIVGEGHNELWYKSLANKLNVDKNIIWHGKVSNTEAKKIISESHFLFLTSVLDAATTVVFEALQSNTPVICHNTCGFGNIIDDTCGVKIPLSTSNQSAASFAKILDDLIENPFKIKEKESGCFKKIQKYNWDVKAKNMFEDYKKLLND